MTKYGTGHSINLWVLQAALEKILPLVDIILTVADRIIVDIEEGTNLLIYELEKLDQELNLSKLVELLVVLKKVIHG